MKGETSYAVVWHEGISGRKASDVTSAYCKFLVESGEKNPIFWTDNCSAQNKNWTFFTALAQTVNSDWGPDSISLKYLETGHRFMSADNIHGCIGKKMRHTNEMIDYRDLIQVVSTSCKKLEVIQMQFTDFYHFTASNKARTAKNIKLPMLSEVSEAYFVRGSRLLYYKLEHESSEYEGVDFLKAKFDVESSLGTHKQPRGVSGKKDGILKLLTHFDGLKRKFYNDFAVNEKSKDLVHVTDV